MTVVSEAVALFGASVYTLPEPMEIMVKKLPRNAERILAVRVIQAHSMVSTNTVLVLELTIGICSSTIEWMMRTTKSYGCGKQTGR